MLSTERLVLKLMEQADETDIIRWRNDREVTESLFSSRGITISEHRNWFDSYVKSGNRIEFMVIKKDDGKKIGTIGLSNIDHRNQKAEYGILLGEKDEWGKGYAKEASIAIINYGFEELNLMKIYLRVFKDNTAAVNLYKKLGFVEEGILRKEYYKNGRFKDVLPMSVLREEWDL